MKRNLIKNGIFWEDPYIPSEIHEIADTYDLKLDDSADTYDLTLDDSKNTNNGLLPDTSHQPMDIHDSKVCLKNPNYYVHKYFTRFGFREDREIERGHVINWPHYEFIENTKVYRVYKDHIVFCPSKSRIKYFSESYNICDEIKILRVRNGIKFIKE